ncbi:hypothetical protein FC82_GL000990 [Secundilactobacillus collinoides DSM 20515 = JCM 1123]|uniref:Uncharacterized protein n=2 Tax=Secundilactobacillus collinoides TaxID=33960 RepID=A0A0R2B518_SECCO|nr:hypothetical protein FC82_GL000990 [Secundilactobacillus collinoides DSM 20515 = JCM 1123]
MLIMAIPEDSELPHVARMMDKRALEKMVVELAEENDDFYQEIRKYMGVDRPKEERPKVELSRKYVKWLSSDARDHEYDEFEFNFIAQDYQTVVDGYLKIGENNVQKRVDSVRGLLLTLVEIDRIITKAPFPEVQSRLSNTQDAAIQAISQLISTDIEAYGEVRAEKYEHAILQELKSQYLEFSRYKLLTALMPLITAKNAQEILNKVLQNVQDVSDNDIYEKENNLAIFQEKINQLSEK